MAFEKLAVLGAGAIGSSIGAYLTRAGRDITLIDLWPANVDAMRHGGLKVTAQEEVFTVKVNALHPGHSQRTPDRGGLPERLCGAAGPGGRGAHADERGDRRGHPTVGGRRAGTEPRESSTSVAIALLPLKSVDCPHASRRLCSGRWEARMKLAAVIALSLMSAFGMAAA